MSKKVELKIHIDRYTLNSNLTELLIASRIIVESPAARLALLILRQTVGNPSSPLSVAIMSKTVMKLYLVFQLNIIILKQSY